MRLSFLPFLFLVVPLSEIAVFVLVGSRIGVLPTIGLVVLTAVVGSALLRHQGLGTLARVQEALREGRAPGRDLVHGVMILLAGFLLLTPGFITDTLGLLLFVPAIRERVFAFLRARVAFVDLAAPRRETGRTSTIDLDAEDWREGPRS